MYLSNEAILQYFPITFPYRYIDEITSVDANRIVASYCFKADEFFYKGHFPGYPVTPGAILMESSVQIGLLAFGMYLLGNGHVELSELSPATMSVSQARLHSGITPANLDHLDLPFGVSSKILSYRFFLASSDLKYKQVIQPEEKIIVTADKIFFKLNKLKVKIKIETTAGELVCKGIVSGFVVNINAWKKE